MECEPRALNQVLLNLLENAAELVEICDDGPGVSPAIRERLFDPFFTTTAPDEGSGLGLMICHRIVTDHDGTIEVCSREGEGATFTVRLPV